MERLRDEREKKSLKRRNVLDFWNSDYHREYICTDIKYLRRMYTIHSNMNRQQLKLFKEFSSGCDAVFSCFFFLVSHNEMGFNPFPHWINQWKMLDLIPFYHLYRFSFCFLCFLPLSFFLSFSASLTFNFVYFWSNTFESISRCATLISYWKRTLHSHIQDKLHFCGFKIESISGKCSFSFNTYVGIKDLQ